jgi:hypothetical protein
MSFLEDQRQKTTHNRYLISKDASGGIFRNLEQEYWLSYPLL